MSQDSPSDSLSVTCLHSSLSRCFQALLGLPSSTWPCPQRPITLSWVCLPPHGPAPSVPSDSPGFAFLHMALPPATHQTLLGLPSSTWPCPQRPIRLSWVCLPPHGPAPSVPSHSPGFAFLHMALPPASHQTLLGLPSSTWPCPQRPIRLSWVCLPPHGPAPSVPSDSPGFAFLHMALPPASHQTLLGLPSSTWPCPQRPIRLSWVCLPPHGPAPSVPSDSPGFAFLHMALPPASHQTLLGLPSSTWPCPRRPIRLSWVCLPPLGPAPSVPSDSPGFAFLHMALPPASHQTLLGLPSSTWPCPRRPIRLSWVCLPPHGPAPGVPSDSPGFAFLHMALPPASHQTLLGLPSSTWPCPRRPIRLSWVCLPPHGPAPSVPSDSPGFAFLHMALPPASHQTLLGLPSSTWPCPQRPIRLSWVCLPPHGPAPSVPSDSPGFAFLHMALPPASHQTLLGLPSSTWPCPQRPIRLSWVCLPPHGPAPSVPSDSPGFAFLHMALPPASHQTLLGLSSSTWPCPQRPIRLSWVCLPPHGPAPSVPSDSPGFAFLHMALPPASHQTLLGLPSSTWPCPSVPSDSPGFAFLHMALPPASHQTLLGLPSSTWPCPQRPIRLSWVCLPPHGPAPSVPSGSPGFAFLHMALPPASHQTLLGLPSSTWPCPQRPIRLSWVCLPPHGPAPSVPSDSPGFAFLHMALPPASHQTLLGLPSSTWPCPQRPIRLSWVCLPPHGPAPSVPSDSPGFAFLHMALPPASHQTLLGLPSSTWPCPQRPIRLSWVCLPPHGPAPSVPSDSPGFAFLHMALPPASHQTLLGLPSSTWPCPQRPIRLSWVCLPPHGPAPSVPSDSPGFAFLHMALPPASHQTLLGLPSSTWPCPQRPIRLKYIATETCQVFHLNLPFPRLISCYGVSHGNRS